MPKHLFLELYGPILGFYIIIIVICGKKLALNFKGGIPFRSDSLVPCFSDILALIN